METLRAVYPRTKRRAQDDITEVLLERFKLHEFYGCAIIDYHGYFDTVRRTTYFTKEFLTLNGLIKVINLKGYMRNRLDKFRNRTAFFETHPLYTIWAGFESTYIHLIVFKVFFIGLLPGRRNPYMMVTPTLGGNSRGFMR